MERRTLELEHGPVHVVDFGGTGRPLLLLHGLGGSHVNWVSVGERLTRYGRVVAVDLIGHGYTEPAGRSATVADHRRVVQDVIAEELGEPVVLVGNSMGGYVSLTVAASTPELVRGLVLVGAALPRPHVLPRDPLVAGFFGLYMVPGLAKRFLAWRNQRLQPEGLVRQVLHLCTVDASRIARSAWDEHLRMAHDRFEMPWSTDAFLQSARSLVARLVGRGRVARMIAAIDAPALIVQGSADRLVPVDVARHLADQRPDWDLVVLDDIGHVPQLEAADRFVEVVGEWLARLDAGAAPHRAGAPRASAVPSAEPA